MDLILMFWLTGLKILITALLSALVLWSIFMAGEEIINDICNKIKGIK